MVEAGFWIAVAALFALAATTIGVWTLVSRMRQLREEEKRLVILGEIEGHLTRLVGQREDLDLRRVEHLLIDMRDGLARLEQRVLETQSSAHPDPLAGDLLIPAPPQTLLERITNRMLIQGFSQVQILFPDSAEALPGSVQNGPHEIFAEARRDGVLYKGRVRVRDGRIEGVDMNPAYSVFP